MKSRLEAQLSFIVEIDKLKAVLRRSRLIDSSRRENSAEHSWHLAVMAILLERYAPQTIDLTRVLKMLLVHDVVEVDAGDTFAYDTAHAASQHERELKGAVRLFGMLPDEQGRELRELWDEFEARSSTESQFANALDRLQPLLQNFYSGGQSWQEHHVTVAQVMERMRPVESGLPEVWPTVLTIIEDARKAGYIAV